MTAETILYINDQKMDCKLITIFCKEYFADDFELRLYIQFPKEIASYQLNQRNLRLCVHYRGLYREFLGYIDKVRPLDAISYGAECGVFPYITLLKHGMQPRCFRWKTVREIIEHILAPYVLIDVSFVCHDALLEYVVQHDESDYALLKAAPVRKWHYLSFFRPQDDFF